jgi:hypothetical protein
LFQRTDKNYPLSLLAELKRRNVFKVAGAYLALGWVVVQLASIIAPAMHPRHRPDRSVRSLNREVIGWAAGSTR